MNLFYKLQSIRKDNQISFFDWIYIYCFGGLLGNIYETILFFVLDHEYVNSSASVISPFNVVYGLGVLLITLALYKINNWLVIWILASIIGGVSEFYMSCFEEYVLGISSWNYSAMRLNIEGRTTIPFAIGWGLLAMILIVLVIPFIIRLIHKIPPKIYKIISITLMIYIVIDWIISFIAVYRYSQRKHGEELALSWFDQIFDDIYMSKHFPNLTFK